MLNFYSFLIYTVIIGCYSEELANSWGHEVLTAEIDDDDDYMAKTTLVEERNINSIIQRGFEASEPIHHDEIVADLGIMKYTLSDSDIVGVNTCEVLKTEVDNELSSIKIDLTCPHLVINGRYTASGYLLTMPIEGNGDYNLDCEDFFVAINTGIKKFKGKDGKMHLKFKTYSLLAEARGRVTYRLSNLFNGDQTLSDALHKFINENWRPVADFAQYPIWYPSMNKILKNTNRFLKSVPLDELILN